MKEAKWLICGTRIKGQGYKELVSKELSKLVTDNQLWERDWQPNLIIEGCCPESADQYAEEWAILHNIPIKHFPSNPGNYLARNIEMVQEATHVIAFWDGYSYGTAHTIAHAEKRHIPIKIIGLKRKGASTNGN